MIFLILPGADVESQKSFKDVVVVF